MATSSSKVYQQISDNIRARAQGKEPYKPYKIQTSYGSRTVGEQEYLRKVEERRQELEQEKLRKRQEEMKARGYTTPEQQLVYNKIQDAKDYVAAIRRQQMSGKLKSAADSIVTGGNKPGREKAAGISKQVLSDISKNLGLKIQNEQNVINNQGRAEDDPARLRAQEELGKLQDRQTAVWMKQNAAQQGGKKQEIRTLPGTYTKEAKEALHDRDSGLITSQDDYVKWMMQGADAGLLDKDKEKQVRQYAFYYNAPDAKNSREYSEYFRNGIESGIFDEGDDLGMQSTGKLQSDLADLKRRKAQAEANSRNSDEINADLYKTLGSQGAYKNLEMNGLYDPFTDEYHLKKPGDYNEWDVRDQTGETRELSTYYDSLLYDSIHGEGAYNNILNNGTDAEFDAADAEIQDLWARLENGTIGQLGDQYNDRISELQGAAYGGESNLDREIRKRQEELNRRETIGKYSGMEGAAYNPSLIDPETEAKYRTELIRLGDEGTAPTGNKTEWLYWIINNISDKEHDYGGGFLGELSGVQAAEQGYRKYSFMTDEMIGQFNALYESGKVKEAQAFMDAIDPYITQLASGRAEELRYNASKGNFGGLYGAMTILRQPIAGLSGTIGSLAAIFGNEDAKNPNSNWYRLQRMNNTTRGARAETWGDFFAKSFGEEYRGAGEWLNGVTYSIADNLMAMALTKGAGKAFGYDMASKSATRVMQFIMSSGAASSTMVQKLNDGMDPTEAAIYAVGDGIIEAITEKYSIEALLKPNVREMLGKPTQILKYLGKNTLAEASEEGASNLLGTTFDQLMSAVFNHESELEAEYNQLISQGMNKTDASRQVWNNWGETLLSEMLAGGLSGFFLSSGNVAQNTVRQAKTGAQIRSKGNVIGSKTGADQLIEAAKGMNEGTQSRELAEGISEKAEKGKKASNYELGRLAQNIIEESTEEIGNIAQDTVQRMVEETLKDQGVSPETISIVAPMITQAAVKRNAGILSRAQMAEIAKSKPAIETLRSFVSNAGKVGVNMVTGIAAEKPLAIRQAVADLMKGGKASTTISGVFAGNVAQARKTADIATKEDMEGLKGKARNNGLDAIWNGEIVQITGKSNGKIDILRENGEHTSVNADELTAAGEAMATLLNYTNMYKGVLGDSAFSALTAEILNNKDLDGTKFVSEALRAYIGFRTGNPITTSALSDKTMEQIRKAAETAAEEARQARLKAGEAYEKAEPGKGALMFDGAEYGTDAWKQKIKKAGLSHDQRNQAAALGEMIRRLGVRVDLINVDNNDMFGYEDSKGRLYINIGAKDESGSGQHLLTVASHELTHWLEHTSDTGYAELREFVLDQLRKRGANIEAMVASTIDQYRQVVKQDLSIEGALAEIVANACDQVLANENTAKALNEEHPDLYRKVKGFAKNFLERVKAATNYSRESTLNTSVESRILWNEGKGQKVLDEIARIYMGARQEALSRQEARTGAEGKEPGAQLSIRQLSAQDKAYADAVKRGDIQAATDMLMDKLAVSENIIPFNAPNWYAGEHADVAQLIKTGTPEAIARAAASMASYVPDNGVLVPMPNHHGQVNNDTDTMILAKAIGELTNRPVIAALEGADRESRYTSKAAGGKGIQAEEMGFRQVKEIPEGTMPIFVDNVVGSGVTAQAAREAMGGGITLAYAKSVRSKGIEGLKRATVTYDRNGELIPLSQRFNPNVRNINYSVRQMDQEYMDAVNSGDMEKAQLMVDQAAKAAGYTLKVYHGTPSGGFNTFRDWSYFTENKGYAERYQSASASSIRSVREGEGNRKVYELYMNPGKVFDTRKAKERKLFNEARMEYGLTSLDNMSRGLPDWTDGRDIIEYIEENGLDYDTVILDEGADGGYGEEVRDRGISYVTKANMVKSAAPVVYDDAGNVIPLSERFNPEQRDIRYSVRQLDDAYMRAARTGDSETMGALVKEAAERAGFDTSRVAYHGTMSFGFTEFNMDDMQSEIFVSYNPELAASYTENDEFKQIHEGEKRPNLKKMKAEDLADYLMEVVRKTGDKSITGIEYLGEDNEGGQQFKTSYILESTGSKKERIITREDVYRMINRRFVTSGVYSLYTRPGKRLVIDAHGSDWNEVVVFDTNHPIDIAGYFNIKDSYGDDVFTTRQIAEFARSKGYDSVEIKNVYDDGMMNDNLDRGRKGKLKGDIAIFFNPNDVKSADTITYDDDGSIIPPSERFSDDSNDLRFSIRQGDMEINRWMEGLTASSLQTEQERTMLKQWKNTRGSLDLARHALFGYRTELSKLEAKPNPTAYEKHQMIVLRDRIEAWQKKVDRYETSLAKATSEKGFAAIMRKQSRIMNDLVNGRTADEVRGTVDAINAELETVQKEMEARKERLKQLAAKEAVIRIRQQLNSAGLKRIAAKLKNDLNSELSNTEIENRLALMALKMKEGNIDEEDVTELADMLIGKMRRTYDSYILDELRGRTITLSQSQQKELKGQNRTIREIRQELAGTGIRIDTKGGNTLDKNWSELCDLIPALSREAADKDMLDQLLNVIAAEKEAARNQYTANMDMEVASMVIDAASNLVPEIVTDKKSMQLIRETLNFIAEMSTEAEESAKALEELNSLMARLQKKGGEAKSTLGKLESNIHDAIAYNNELSTQSEQANWLTERHKLIDQLKSEHTQEMLRQQAEFKLKIEKDKAARGLMNENMALRRRINTNILRVRNLLMKESVKQNVPEHMKGLAREMLDLIVRNDMSGRKITGMDLKMLQETRRVLDAWEAQDGKYSPDQLKGLDEAVQDAVYNALEDIKAGIDFYNASTKGSELTVNLQAFKNALTRISEGVSEITGIINAERSIALGDRRVAVEDQAYKVQESAGNRRAKVLIGRLGQTITALRKAITSGNLTPEYFFKMLKNEGLDDLWEEYHRAENRNGLELANAKKRLDEIAQKHGYKEWDTNARQAVKLESGTVNMTLGQIMSLYATWKREHTLGPAMSQHLQNGGFYVEEYDPREGIIGRREVDLKAHRVTEADMEMVNGLLTDEQKQFVDDIVGYMSTDMSELGNDASMKAYGIRMYKESYYFPFKMWDGIRARASNDSGSAAAANDRAFHPSFSKTRLHGANNALMLGDFMTTAADHIVGMINYATMGLANENLQKVLNAQVPEGERLDQMTRRTIRTVLEEAYGRTMTEYLAKLQEQLNGGVGRVDRTVYDRMLTLFRKNAVAGSMSVALQQPLSYIRAAMMINPKYMTEALAREYWQGSYQERMKHSGVSVIKDMGRFDMGFGKGAREYITPDGKEGKIRKAWDAVTDKATILPELMDRWTWNRLWVAVKAEQHDLHPDMDVKSDAFLDMVGERFNDIVRKTQVYDSTLTKSQNMRSQNPFVKSITSFMAEPTLSLNVLADAVQNAKEKGGKMKLAKALATFALSAMAQAAAKALMSTGRSPDEKKTWKENYLYRYYANLISEADPMNLIPGYNDLITLLKDGKLEDDAMGVLGKLFTAGDKLAGMFKAGAGYREIEDGAGQIIQLLTQLPAKNIMRDLRAMYNWFIGKPYADRETSAAVIRLQTEASLMTADNLLGVIRAKLGEAGYKVTNSAYYDRMYSAYQRGDQQGAEAIREYLTLGKGVDESQIDSNMRTMTRKGNLFPALEANKAAEIAAAIKGLQEFGAEVKDIKSAITKEMKPKYLAADAAGKVKIRDAIQKAYKAMGLTAADADKVINGWKDE